MEKVAVIDKHAEDVRWVLHTILHDDTLWQEILTVARGRHVLGSHEFGDANLFEWSDGRVRSESIQELADWVVYRCWLRERAEKAQSSV